MTRIFVVLFFLLVAGILIWGNTLTENMPSGNSSETTIKEKGDR